MAKWANFPNNGVHEMNMGLLDGREDGEHSGIGCVVKSKIFEMLDSRFFRMEPLDEYEALPDECDKNHQWITRLLFFFLTVYPGGNICLQHDAGGASTKADDREIWHREIPNT